MMVRKTGQWTIYIPQNSPIFQVRQRKQDFNEKHQLKEMITIMIDDDKTQPIKYFHTLNALVNSSKAHSIEI